MPANLRVVHGGRGGRSTPPAGAENAPAPPEPEVASGAAPDAASGAPMHGTSGAAPDEPPPRVDIIRARIASDYYGQAHVRERILKALLEFLNE